MSQLSIIQLKACTELHLTPAALLPGEAEHCTAADHAVRVMVGTVGQRQGLSR
jgi:hypothetical protein